MSAGACREKAKRVQYTSLRLIFLEVHDVEMAGVSFATRRCPGTCPCQVQLCYATMPCVILVLSAFLGRSVGASQKHALWCQFPLAGRFVRCV